jgi:hypothetical protein
METIYIVQAFNTGKRGKVVAEKPLTFKTADEARRRAAKLGEVSLGVLAYAQTADAEAGEYEDPVEISRHGEVPEM